MHVSTFTYSSNLVMRLCEQMALTWQSERPQWPLSAPESKRSKVDTSLSYAMVTSACTGWKDSYAEMVCASMMFFSLMRELKPCTSSVYLLKTTSNLLCALTRASKATSSAAFFTWHVSAKHLSWGVSISRERHSASMAEMEGSQSCCHQTSLRPMWWCLAGSKKPSSASAMTSDMSNLWWWMKELVVFPSSSTGTSPS